MSVPAQVVKLVNQFKDQLQAVKSPQYKEAWVRTSYIDPFFKALGWDVHQENSGSLIHKEVVHEDSLRVEGAMKAPDYCFYTGGARKFFVEAKKPSVNLFDGKAAAFQVRRYAWSAKLPLSILTNFKELTIYDCRVRPQKEDKASIAQSLYMTYEAYPDRWDDIASIFSKEAVLSGSLDAYTQDLKKKRGIDTVDDAFLKEMEVWREILAKDLAKRNPSLTRRELNYAVQMTIDRIVFLRICEDRGIEDYGNLESLAGKDNVYDNLRDAFKVADDKYNSGLFHFREEKGRDELPDDLTLELQLSDQPLKKIIKGLYYPESPYQFSVMPVEIMGQVYEQFLGKVISVTPDHRVVIEEKPEVKKAGGVYYTPSYIVDYIVENTVGKLLEGKTPRQASKLKVLDPACGSGSFLVGAYNYLLEWHREWYVKAGSDKHAKTLYERSQGEWQLTTAEKKRILLNNIYGVDIDTQAVEVTKLSLLLKVLDGETNETLNDQLTFFQERALPDLDNNIKSGNSLVGPDFYENEQMSFLNEEERYRINAFEWQAEFSGIMKTGGFDVVIGNPPYVSFGLRNVGTLGKKEASYYRARFANSAQYKISTYAVFTQLAIELLREGGLTSSIVPDSFLLGHYFSQLRRYILDNCAINQIVLIQTKVFHKGTVGTSVILNATKTRKQTARESCRLVACLCNDTTQFLDRDFRHHEYPQSYFEQLTLNRFRLFFSNYEKALVDKVERASHVELSRLVKLSSGLIGKQGKDSITSSYQASPAWKEGLLSGEEIRRYAVGYKGGYILFDKTHLKSGFKDARYFEPKLFGRQTGDKLVWAYDQDGLLCLNNLHVGNVLDETYDLKYILSILNSRLMNEYYSLITLERGRALAQTDIETLSKLPIRIIDFSDSRDVAHYDRMIYLVTQMLKLHEQLSSARTSNDKNHFQREINATDYQIDRLVYELYGLTEDEIKIVEKCN